VWSLIPWWKACATESNNLKDKKPIPCHRQFQAFCFGLCYVMLKYFEVITLKNFVPKNTKEKEN
jgi:hypothetical protein